MVPLFGCQLCKKASYVVEIFSQLVFWPISAASFSQNLIQFTLQFYLLRLKVDSSYKIAGFVFVYRPTEMFVLVGQKEMPMYSTCDLL